MHERHGVGRGSQAAGNSIAPGVLWERAGNILLKRPPHAARSASSSSSDQQPGCPEAAGPAGAPATAWRARQGGAPPPAARAARGG